MSGVTLVVGGIAVCGIIGGIIGTRLKPGSKVAALIGAAVGFLAGAGLVFALLALAMRGVKIFGV